MSCKCKGRSHVCEGLLNGLPRWSSKDGLYVWELKRKGTDTEYIVLKGFRQMKNSSKYVTNYKHGNFEQLPDRTRELIRELILEAASDRSKENDDVFWNEFTDEMRAMCARKNCRLCRGTGEYWAQTNTDLEHIEVDSVRCKCTRLKQRGAK